MSESGTASLFDDSPANGSRRLFFATNRYNLLEILSSGLIAPRAAYDKYYDDYLERAPGRIVLLADSLPSQAVAIVSAESPTSFPVALEIDSTVLTADAVPALTKSGDDRLPLSADGVFAWAPASALPTTAVIAIHFRSQGELSEHQAREYPNIRDDGSFSITPELFTDNQRPELEPWLATLSPATDPTGDDFERIDRLTGALALLASELPASRAAFENYVGLVTGVVKKKRARARADDALPAWLTRPFTGTAARTPDADEVLFAAAWGVLIAHRPTAKWRPLEITAGIREQLRNSKHADALSAALNRIDSILRNEIELEPFKSGRGLDSAKALLLVLLRPEPDRLLAWRQDETGADEIVRAGAATLSGLLTGRKRLATTRRPRELDNLFATIELALLEMPDGLSPPPHVDLQVEERSATAGRELALMAGGVAQVSHRQQRATLASRLSESQLLGGEPEYELALQIALELGWADAVTTVVSVEHGFYAVTTGKAIELRVDGIPTVVRSLKPDDFRRRLVTDGIPDELSSRLENDLASGSGERRVASPNEERSR